MSDSILPQQLPSIKYSNLKDETQGKKNPPPSHSLFLIKDHSCDSNLILYFSKSALSHALKMLIQLKYNQKNVLKVKVLSKSAVKMSPVTVILSYMILLDHHDVSVKAEFYCCR